MVLPLTVEPSTPRLCIDARFLNLWMRDSPFSLDKLRDVPRYVYPDSLMSKIDDKSGYDNVLLIEESMQYFGIRWGGLVVGLRNASLRLEEFSFRLSNFRFVGNAFL